MPTTLTSALYANGTPELWQTGAMLLTLLIMLTIFVGIKCLLDYFNNKKK